MRVAIVHEWFVGWAGSERVVAELLRLFPDADLYALIDVLPDEERSGLQGRPVRTSFLQRVPGVRRFYRSLLPLMPLAVEQFDLSGYDLVLSSSHAVAKGVLTGPDTLHVGYVHTPMRYAWDLQHAYLRAAGLERGPRGWLTRWLLHRLRLWDRGSATGVDVLVANSSYVARRIGKVYRREAEVVHPPVDVAAFALHEAKDEAYLTASRMVPYKRLDLVAAAFRELPERRLRIVGDGPELARVRAAAGPNATFLGRLSDAALRAELQRARAFVFAAEEDFGILPVEAMACGTPVIAYGRGGVRDSVVALDGAGDAAPTGVFFDTQTPAALAAAVRDFEAAGSFDPRAVRSRAETFAAARFRERMTELVERHWQAFRERRGW